MFGVARRRLPAAAFDNPWLRELHDIATSAISGVHLQAHLSPRNARLGGRGVALPRGPTCSGVSEVFN